MKTFFKPVGLLIIAIITFLSLIISGETFVNQKSKAKGPPKTMPQVRQGRYLVMMSGCNDCHTHGYLQLEGKVPEPD